MAASSRLGVLMKLDKNQRKPRVFKASDLCPYYNRRVDATNDTRCFHLYKPNILSPFIPPSITRGGNVSFCHILKIIRHRPFFMGNFFFARLYTPYMKRKNHSADSSVL